MSAKGLKREIREELNLDVTPTALLAVCCFDKIAQEGLGFAFKVVPKRQKADVNPNRKEIKKVKWFTLNGALNLPNRLVRRGLKEVLRSYKRGKVLTVREFYFWEGDHKCRRLR